MSKRIALGLLVMIAASSVNLLPDAAPALGMPALDYRLAHAGIPALLSAFLGALVARRGFILPAVILRVVFHAVTLKFLYDIAYPQATYASLLQVNGAAIAMSLLATLLGAWAGQRLRSAPDDDLSRTTPAS